MIVDELSVLEIDYNVAYCFGVIVLGPLWTFNKCVKINKQKLQLNRVERPEGGALKPCDNSRAQQEKERFYFFPGKDSAKKSHGLFFYYSLPPSFFSLKKEVPFPLGTCTWLTMGADTELQFSADPE